MTRTGENITLSDGITFATWRVLNVVGWGAVGVSGALFLRLGMESAATLAGGGFGEAYSMRHQVLYVAVVAIGGAVATGLFIGQVCGSRIARRPAVVATTLAVLFAATQAWLFAGLGPDGFLRFVQYSGFVGIPVAWLAAQASASRRPRALLRR